MLWARAASRIFLTLGTLARQRGRAPQLPFMKSSRSSAVVLGSTVTGLSSGAGGVFTLAQSATISPAWTGSAAIDVAPANAAHASTRAKRDMVPSHRLPRRVGRASALNLTQGGARSPSAHKKPGWRGAPPGVCELRLTLYARAYQCRYGRGCP